MSILTLAFGGLVQPAQANPIDGIITAGRATITSANQNLDVHQTTNRAIIDWRGFDIAPNESTTFHQPSANSITLNRVHSADPSKIDGHLSANGNIIIINQNGILFGPTSHVDVNGLIATTADIDNAKFMHGSLKFDKAGNPDASVINEGTITAKDAGLVGLVAPNVSNSGTITANLGRVQLASGDTVTVDLYGDKLLEVAVGDDVKSQLVSNTGIINAAGGQIAITAAAGKNIVNSLVIIKGELNAPTVEQKNGEIYIHGGGSQVAVQGKLNVTGKNAGEKGGAIAIDGDDITLLIGSTLDASGMAGGGSVKVGGDFHGGGPMPTAKTVSVDSGVLINADALASGNGGDVAIWSDDNTNFNGLIQARGGVLGGDGGNVETSGAILNVGGLVDASAINGAAGSWLLDPNNVIIRATGANTNVSAGPTYTTTNNNAYITTGSIQTALNAGTNVTITTANAGTNSQLGNITVSDAITKSAGGNATLTLNAANNIAVNAAITSTTGKLSLVLDADSDASSSGQITIASNIATNGGDIVMGGGANALTGYAVGNGTYSYGVYINNATVDAGGGNITMHGQGYNETTGGNYGIRLMGASAILKTSGTGTINMTGIGVGSATAGSNYGVELDNAAAITTTAGALNVTGTAGGTAGLNNYGVYLQGGTIGSTNGDIALTGTGAASTGGGEYGVRISGANSFISATGTGKVIVNAHGGGTGNGSDNYGLVLDGGGIISTNTGLLTVLANGGGTGSGGNNYGLYLNGGGSTIKATGAGNVNITGNGGDAGGSGDSNYGVYALNDIVTSAGGTITVNGTGGNSSLGGNHGVRLNGATVSTTGAGTITVTGTGAGTGLSGTDYGVELQNGATISTVNGANTVIAAGGTGSGGGNYGLYLQDANSAVKATGSGNVTVRVGGSNFVNLTGANAISTNTGRWLVYSTNPAGDTNGGLAYNFRRFSCTFGGLCPSIPTTGNGFLYMNTPVLTATPTALALTYGDAKPSLTGYGYTLSDYLDSDQSADAITGALNGTTNYALGSNTGTYNINYANGALTSAMGYGFVYSNNAAAISVARKNITATFGNSLSKTYGDANPSIDYNNITFTSLVGNDQASLFTTITPNFSAVGVNAGIYNVSAAIADTMNYHIINTPATTLTINKKNITAAFNNLLSKTYGDANPIVTYNNFTFNLLVGSDSASLFTGITNNLSGLSNNAGTYAVNATIADTTNYHVTNAPGTTLTINKALLTVTPNNASRLYGTANPAFSGIITGFKYSDSASALATQPTYSTAALNISPVGHYTINATGAPASNYTFNYQTGTLTINALTLPSSVNNIGVNPIISPIDASTIINSQLSSQIAQATDLSSLALLEPAAGGDDNQNNSETAQNEIWSDTSGSLILTPALIWQMGWKIN